MGAASLTIMAQTPGNYFSSIQRHSNTKNILKEITNNKIRYNNKLSNFLIMSVVVHISSFSQPVPENLRNYITG